MCTPPSGKSKVKEEPRADNFSPDGNSYNTVAEIQGVATSYRDDDVARASLAQMNEISRRVNAVAMSFPIVNGPSVSGPSSSRIITANGVSQQQQQQLQPAQPVQNGVIESPPSNSEDALQRVEELSRLRSEQQLSSSVLSEMQMQPIQQPSPSSSHHSSDVSLIQTYTNGNDSLYGMNGVDGMDIYTQAGITNGTSMDHAGLQVFTLGHLIPKQMSDDDSAIWNFDPATLGNVDMSMGNGSNGIISDYNPAHEQSQASSSTAASNYDLSDASSTIGRVDTPMSIAESVDVGNNVVRTGTPTSAKLRVRRSTFVPTWAAPTWAVPPRVLLVDDDAVSRRLSSKFLQVFGCSIDIAVDGDIAVNKMNIASYDLVLMVRLIEDIQTHVV